MAKAKTPKKASPSAKPTMTIAGPTVRGRTVRFGAVTVTVGELATDVATRNIKQGQRALKRASKALARPGVTLGRTKGIPLFRAHPKVPGRVIRLLDGKQAAGTFDENGTFKTIAR